MDYKISHGSKLHVRLHNTLSYCSTNSPTYIKIVLFCDDGSDMGPRKGMDAGFDSGDFQKTRIRGYGYIY